MRKGGRSHCSKYADRSDETVPRAHGIERWCRHWEPGERGFRAEVAVGGLRREELWQQLTQELEILSGDFFPLPDVFQTIVGRTAFFFQCVIKHTAISEFTMKDLFRSRFFKSDTWPLARDLPCWQALCCPRPGLTGLSECRAPRERKGQLSSPPILKDTDPLAC